MTTSKPTKRKPTRAGKAGAGFRSSTSRPNFTGIGQPLASDWHRLGEGFSCQFGMKGLSLTVLWEPHIPEGEALARILASGKYHEARNQFLQALAARLGANVACIDVGGAQP